MFVSDENWIYERPSEASIAISIVEIQGERLLITQPFYFYIIENRMELERVDTHVECYSGYKKTHLSSHFYVGTSYLL